MDATTPSIESIRIRGFRSLADVDLSGLGPATVLIGPNGSGKSNVLRFLDMLHYMLVLQRLGRFVERQGGANDQLFGGSEATDQIEAEITMRADEGLYDYRFTLEYAHPDRFYFSEESFRHRRGEHPTGTKWQDLGSEHREANLVIAAQSEEFPHLDRAAARQIINTVRRCRVYHFHNTDDRSHFKRSWLISHRNTLRNNGGNLAPVLYRMEREDQRRYARICRYIGRILPGFDHFDMEESNGRVGLSWKADWSDRSFGAHLTSDGSLRTFALVTLLNLPSQMLPDVVLLDEPELGLHPSAVTLIGGMISSLSARKQVIVATQSPLLVNSFEIDQIRVLELQNGCTQALKYDPDEYQRWLEDYSTGELWQRNLLGGHP